MRQWHGSVRFVAIYIQEAHAKDEWPISEAPREFRQHRGIGERLAAARAFIEDYKMPPQVAWYCDTMDDNFNKAYASWPFRFWVLEPATDDAPHTVAFKPMPKNASYDLSELDTHLRQRQSSGRG